MYVYKITINVDDKVRYYIGKCRTGDMSYMGSGKILMRYYKKYGKNIIKHKEILFETDSEEELREAEIKYIRESNAVIDPAFLNIYTGGEGGIKLHAEAYNNWLLKLRAARPQGIIKYKQTCSKRTDTQKILISSNISTAVKAAIAKIPTEIRIARHKKSVDTYVNRSAHQKLIEQQRKSAAAKRVAAERTTEQWIDYGLKVSAGVKNYRSKRTPDEKIKHIRAYRTTMYLKNGMLILRDTVCELIRQETPSIEIFKYIRSTGIHTHHNCVKLFIDFLKSYHICNI